MQKGYCVHFNGIQHPTCNAGHNYEDKARPISQEELKWKQENYPDTPILRTAIARRIPCHEENNVYTCADYLLPTNQELAEYNAKMDKYVEEVLRRFNIVRPAIVKDIEAHNAKRRFFKRNIACPICETGEVNYVYHGHYNGHIQAECTTDDCVHWIE